MGCCSVPKKIKNKFNKYLNKRWLVAGFLLVFFLGICLIGAGLAKAEEQKPLVPCSTSVDSTPCTLCHLVVGFENIYKKFFLPLLFIAVIFFIVVAGVIYMVSSGNKALMDWAKKALTYSLTAFILFLCSWLIVNAILTALGYNKGTWWTFECDTAQTQGTSTGAASQQPAAGGTSSPSGEAGTCQNIPTQANIGEQCKDVSPALSGLLSCMRDKLPTGAQISSISDSAGYENCKNNWSKPPCAHAQGSCHYGGSCTDGSHAADISTAGGSVSGSAIQDVANQCGANYVLDEGNHIHVSMGQGCGCN